MVKIFKLEFTFYQPHRTLINILIERKICGWQLVVRCTVEFETKNHLHLDELFRSRLFRIRTPLFMTSLRSSVSFYLATAWYCSFGTACVCNKSCCFMKKNSTILVARVLTLKIKVFIVTKVKLFYLPRTIIFKTGNLENKTFFSSTVTSTLTTRSP